MRSLLIIRLGPNGWQVAFLSGPAMLQTEVLATFATRKEAEDARDAAQSFNLYHTQGNTQ
jgi:hypothetical protein